jgi:hypothetical protein
MNKGKTLLDPSGMGMVEAVFILGVVTFMLMAVLSFDNFLRSQKVQFSELAALDSIALTMGRLIDNNTSWNYTTANNPSMGCLRNANGAGCGACNPIQFNGVYDTAGVLYYNGAGANGLTKGGGACNTYPSRNCPFQFVLQFASLDGAAVPWVGVAITLRVGKNPSPPYNSFSDLVFNLNQHGYTPPSWANCMNQPGIIKRMAVYP